MSKGTKSKLYWPVALLLAVLFLTGCQLFERERVVGFTGHTMGTTFSVQWVDLSEERITPLRNEIGRLLAEVNQQMSTYIPDSELSRFNQAPADSEMAVSNALAEVVAQALEISADTAGAFDVTVGPLVNLWGFGPDGRVIHAPDPREIDQQLSRIGYDKISVLNDPTRLKKRGDQYVDLSAIAKGYGVDRVADLLESRGIDRYLVEIGGELRARGLKPEGVHWRIAIESPVSEARGIGRIINVKDIGIATSGDYRNYFEENGVRFSHTINPETGRPISHRLASVTVLRPTCAEADALATSLMVMGEERGFEWARKRGIAAYFLVKDDLGEGFIERSTPEFEAFVQ